MLRSEIDVDRQGLWYGIVFRGMDLQGLFGDPILVILVKAHGGRHLGVYLAFLPPKTCIGNVSLLSDQHLPPWSLPSVHQGW